MTLEKKNTHTHTITWSHIISILYMHTFTHNIIRGTLEKTKYIELNKIITLIYWVNDTRKKKTLTHTQLHEVILYLYYICTHSHITL